MDSPYTREKSGRIATSPKLLCHLSGGSSTVPSGVLLTSLFVVDTFACRRLPDNMQDLFAAPHPLVDIWLI
jgi:hypothetical protein